MARRLAAALLAAAALAAALAAAALGAFSASVQATGPAFAAYAVPAPANLRCTGLSSPASSRIAWDAIAPPPANAVAYVVTAPGGRQTTTAATTYDLPAVSLLPGQYAVQAQISSGWRSPAATITVSLAALGLLYLCSTP